MALSNYTAHEAVIVFKLCYQYSSLCACFGALSCYIAQEAVFGGQLSMFALECTHHYYNVLVAV